MIKDAAAPKSSIDRETFFGIFLLITALAFALRAADLTTRPLHNDEGVNFYFLDQMDALGYFPYSHENYHGPSYFYLTYLTRALLGHHEIGLRASAVLTGTALLFLLLPLAQIAGRRFVLIAALLIALSSSHLFFSRYAIHETLFLLSGLGFGLAMFSWWHSGARRSLYAASVWLAIHAATKETFIITGFCVVCGLLALGKYRRTWERIKQALPDLAPALLLFAVIGIALFTGGFRWSGGLVEASQAVQQWIGRNESDTGHHKPFWYYISRVILVTEPHLAAFLVLPLLLLVVAPRRVLTLFSGDSGALGRFLYVHTIASWLVYSFVAYKTVWLEINFTVPAAISLAWLTSALMKQGEAGESGKVFADAGRLAVAALVASSAYFAWHFNFKVPYDQNGDSNPGSSNPFCYVHTTRGMLEVVWLISEYKRDHPGARILIGVNGYWPLPFYLRHWSKDLGYITDNAQQHAKDYDVVLLEKGTVLRDPQFEPYREYRISEVEETYLYFRRRS